MRYMMLLMIVTIFLGACGDAGTDTEDTGNENVPDQEEAHSIQLRNIDVEAEDLQVSVTGEASTEKNEFYYRVEEEGEVIMEEEHVSLEASDTEWIEFDLTLDLAGKYSQNEEPPIIVLYGKNSEGDMVNPNFIPIDL
ncbi:hypothetical protein [Virgibacillus kimchii]